jgi:NADH-quinone oxidoreductase subunit E
VNGADLIAKALFEELAISDGGTTEDGLFSIKEVACLGCCSLSPVMMIGETTYGSLTPKKAKEIVRAIRSAEELKQ